MGEVSQDAEDVHLGIDGTSVNADGRALQRRRWRWRVGAAIEESWSLRRRVTRQGPSSSMIDFTPSSIWRNMMDTSHATEDRSSCETLLQNSHGVADLHDTLNTTHKMIHNLGPNCISFSFSSFVNKAPFAPSLPCTATGADREYIMMPTGLARSFPFHNFPRTWT